MSDNQLTPQPEPVQAPLTPQSLLQWSSPVRLTSNQDLSQLLKFKSARTLTWLSRNKSEHYSTLTIRKKNGSLRYLHNPSNLMRVVQFKLLNEIFNKVAIPDYVYAFEKNKSIPTMAQIHVGKKVVLSVDIKDFFHSIKQTRLQEIFTQHLGIADMPARTMSELCTYQAFVPQGALTSPKVANIVTATSFGPILKTYCDQNGLTLSIYADDVTISSTNPALNVSDVLRFVTETIMQAGFRVNHEKTKVMWDTARQYVCGVVVNSKTNMLKRERYKLRAIVHNIVKNGVEAEALKSGVEPGHFASHILGRLNWFKQLNSALAEKHTRTLQNYLAKERETKGTITRPTNPTPSQESVPQTAGAVEATLPW